ncbi:MAG: T9SS type A sorting domain-containing protein [Bacteroidota bacterium]
MNTLLRLSLFFTLLGLCAMLNQVTAQANCTSHTDHAISGAGAVEPTICWEFARAFLIKNTNGDGTDKGTNTIPSSWELGQQDETEARYCLDSDFALTTDASEADVIIFDNGNSLITSDPGHVAVALGGGSFISKQTDDPECQIHGICSPVSGGGGNVKAMFTYRERKRGLGDVSSCSCFVQNQLATSCSQVQPPQSCINTTTGTVNFSTTLQTYHNLSSYYNTVSLSSSCSELDWSKLFGNGSWSASSSGKTLWIYLDAGEYLFMEMSTPDEANINTFFFERPSGGGWLRVGQSASGLIHPNPFESYVFVPDTYLGSKLTIFDVQGKLVKQMEIRQQKVDLSDLGAGMYMLQGRTIDGDFFTEKIVKQ